MKIISMIAIGALCACAEPRSSFDFILTGDATDHVISSAYVTGEVNNAGQLALDDADWGLFMNLNGLAIGDHALTSGSGELSVMNKSTGDIFTTSVGGSCTVHVGLHENSNGSVVSGWFDCTELATSDGKHVVISGGRYSTQINDSANNPQLQPPGP